MMEFESYRRVPPRIQLSSLIDVLFIVLVFVMLVARFDQPRGLEVDLPRADVEAVESGAAQPVVLVVPRMGPMRIGEREVAEADLQPALRRARSRSGPLSDTLLLRADGGIPLDRITRLLAAASRAGFAAVSIATQPFGSAP